MRRILNYMISPFAKNSANWFVSLKDNTFFFLYLSPLLPKQFHKLREHLENIEKEKKIMLIFSILFQCFFHFLSWKLFLCSQNYNVYRFLYFYTAWRKWKHQKGRWWLFQILKILPRGRHDRLVLCKFKVSIRGRDNIHLAYYREKVSFSCHCQINGTWWACKREELEVWAESDVTPFGGKYNSKVLQFKVSFWYFTWHFPSLYSLHYNYSINIADIWPYPRLWVDAITNEYLFQGWCRL